MRCTRIVACLSALAALVLPVSAHFQTLLPPTDIVERPGDIDLRMVFTHPMEQGPVMQMGKPQGFGALVAGRRIDLAESLRPVEIDGKTAWRAEYAITEPGDHVFYIEPAPYWEPAEGKMIVHYTKTVVNAMGMERGWDELVGLPVEIEPLVRPYGLWAGNLFRGIVRRRGEPVPFAEVEVEYWNEGRKVGIPAEPYITQVVKADANGVFSYAMPRAGWWAFAALVEGEETMAAPTGEEVPVELGGLMWVRTREME